jgi:hypothetical protein
VFEKEDLKLISKVIEEIRVSNDLGRRTCLGYANPPEGSLEGDVVCPKCGGKLEYSVSSYNGATKGKCRTTGCLVWAE